MLLVTLAQPLVGLEQLEAVDQEVVEIHGVEFALAGFVVTVHPQDAVYRRVPVPETGGRDLLQRPLGVGGQADHGEEHFRFGELLPAEAEPGHHLAHQALGVVLVQDGVVGRVAQHRGVAAKQAVGHVVEGAAPQAADRFPHQGMRTVQHFAGGLVGEGEKQGAPGIDPPLHEVGHPVGQGPGLAGAGGGNDQHGSVRGGHRGQLLLVEFRLEVDGCAGAVHGCWMSSRLTVSGDAKRQRVAG